MKILRKGSQIFSFCMKDAPFSVIAGVPYEVGRIISVDGHWSGRNKVHTTCLGPENREGFRFIFKFALIGDDIST